MKKNLFFVLIFLVAVSSSYIIGAQTNDTTSDDKRRVIRSHYQLLSMVEAKTNQLLVSSDMTERSHLNHYIEGHIVALSYLGIRVPFLENSNDFMIYLHEILHKSDYDALIETLNEALNILEPHVGASNKEIDHILEKWNNFLTQF